MTYARARLYLGITNIGFWVIVSAAGILASLPTRLFPTPDADPSESAARMAVIVVGYILLSLPFDLVGGYILPRRFDRPAPALPQYLLGWLRGVLVQGVILFLVGMLFITAGRQSRSVALVVVLAAIVMFALVALQEPLARLSGGLRRVKADLSSVGKVLKRWNLSLTDNVVVLDAKDPGFVGGLAGLPGGERLILPAAWLTQLPEDNLAAQIVRRIGAIQRGTRERGVYLAIAWNVVGFAAAASFAGAEAVSSARGLLTTILWFNLWSFIGLLILPSLSRPGVYEVDRFAQQAGVPKELLDQTIQTLDKWQDDEPERPRLVETIFHPVPSVNNRLERLAIKGAKSYGAWHGARMALYLSWGCLGMLSRAVHGNAGRPELWVLLPGD